MKRRLHRARMRMWHSVRGRATVIVVGVSAVVLALCAVLAVSLIRFGVSETVTGRVAHTARSVGYLAVAEPGRSIVTPAGETNLVQVVSRQGKVLAASQEMRGRGPLASSWPAAPETRVEETVCPPYLDRCARVVGVLVPSLDAIAYAAEPEPPVLTEPTLPLVAAGVTGLLLALVGTGTWWTIGRTFKPVDEIRAELADINARHLDRRVPVPDTGGEVQVLAETINGVLERLEKATARERRFISDASHDLRNPIAGLRATLEVALDDPEPGPLVKAALGHTERLNDIVVDLLELARLDAGAQTPVTRIDLAELVTAETRFHEHRVPLELKLEPRVEVEAGRLRLSRVLNNLLANAERHARTRVVVTVAREGGEAVLRVCDDGSGIPDDQRERVFERFARLDESRARDPHGTGLGLPIAREIARTYGGSLIAEPSCEGAHLVLRLPLAT